MFYKEEDDCPWCDSYAETYTAVAKKLKDVMRFYTVDCEAWAHFITTKANPDFSIPQCEEEQW